MQQSYKVNSNRDEPPHVVHSDLRDRLAIPWHSQHVALQ
eukprot:COSAG06_NODE_34787_length_469_cov_0.975676_1_plen_38_part_01